MAKHKALSKITTRAKLIRKKSPGKKWSACIKQAGADYRAGRLGATLLVEKGESRRTKPKRVVQIKRTKTGTFKGMQTIGGAKSTLREHYREQLQKALFRRDQATTKRDKKAFGKKVTEARKQFNKFC